MSETCLLAQEFALEVRRREASRESDRKRVILDQILKSPDLYRAVARDIYARMPGQVADALGAAFLAFQRCDRTLEVTLCIIYGREATICHASNLDHLETFCRIAQEVCGVSRFEIRGSDLWHRVERAQEGGWISTMMGGGFQ